MLKAYVDREEAKRAKSFLSSYKKDATFVDSDFPSDARFNPANGRRGKVLVAAC